MFENWIYVENLQVAKNKIVSETSNDHCSQALFVRLDWWPGSPASTIRGVQENLLVNKFYGQATKGMRWMPWHLKAMKDVKSCDKRRLGAPIHWPVDLRMGEPFKLLPEFIGQQESTQGSEPSQYLKEKKTTVIP